MSTVYGASIFLFELLKKKRNLESICFPSYEMNAGSWVLIIWWMQCMNIEHYKWEALINFLREKERKKHVGEKNEKQKKKKIVRFPARVLNSRPSCFPAFQSRYTNALI